MTPKRGRKKGSKNREYFLRESIKRDPRNFAFWKCVLKKQEVVNAFLDRGSKQQKETIKEILIYLKRADMEFFNRVNGEETLKEIG